MSYRIANVFCLLVVFVASAVAAAEPDLSKYRTGVADPRLARVAEEVQRGIFVEPEKHIDALVQDLTEGERDPFQRVKVIHDWIAANIAYDTESYFANTRIDSAWAATLRRRKSVCQGYSALMQTMCERAGIECQQVPGQARGFGFAAKNAAADGAENHAWNAVRIGGNWYLVDVTWDAGIVAADGFKKQFGHAYLFPRPEGFLHTHFPQDPKWQLVERPISAEAFSRFPNLKGRFFAHGLRLKSQVGSRIDAGRSIKLSLTAAADVVVSAKLNSTDGEALPRHTLLQRVGDSCMLLALFPQAGSYELELFCKRQSDSGSLRLAATFAIDAAEATTRVFPQTFSIYHELPACLYQPLFLPLAETEATTFEVRVPTADQVLLAIGRKPWIALRRDEADRDLFRAKVSIADAKQVKLMVRRPGDGNTVPTLVDFSLPDCPPTHEVSRHVRCL